MPTPTADPCCFSDLADLAERVSSLTAHAIEDHDPSFADNGLADLARLRVALVKMTARVDGLLEVYA